MKSSLRILLLPALIWAGSSFPATASVIFKPSENTKYVAPGEEEIGGNAEQLWAKAQAAEQNGDIGTAMKAYRTLVRRHSHNRLAGDAVYRLGQLQEQKGDYLKAAQSYNILAEKFPKSEHFDDALASMFRIGEMYLAGKKKKILGVPIRSSMDEAAAIFGAIVRVAPYGKLTARAMFNIGRAREKQGANEAAIKAYQDLVEKFPDDSLAVDAQYQIGYIYAQAAKSGNTYDPNAANKAKTGFEDFLYKYPHSEKSAQARDNLKMLETKQTSTAFEIARFYDKQKSYRAAAIYYNDVIRQQPNSPEGDRAKKRISELRAKFGDAALQPPAVSAATANKKLRKPEAASSSSHSESTSPPPEAPLPSADIDLSLPPPASLLPDTTTAPPPSTTEPLPEPATSLPEPATSEPSETTPTPEE